MDGTSSEERSFSLCRKWRGRGAGTEGGGKVVVFSHNAQPRGQGLSWVTCFWAILRHCCPLVMIHGGKQVNRINLSKSRIPRCCHCDFQDTGTGLSPKVISSIFKICFLLNRFIAFLLLLFLNREIENELGRETEGEGDRESQAGSALSAQSQTWSSNSQTVRS